MIRARNIFDSKPKKPLSSLAQNWSYFWVVLAVWGTCHTELARRIGIEAPDMDTLQQQLIAKFQLPNTQTKTLLQRTAMEYAERINKPILNRDQLMHQYRHAAVNVAKWEISKEYREAVRSEAEKNTEKL